MVSLSYQCILLKNFINNYRWTMLAQYLVSLGETASRKTRSRSNKTVNYPQGNKEKSFHVHVCGKLMHR